MAADETILIDVKGDADKYARQIADLANEMLELQKATAKEKKEASEAAKVKKAAAKAALAAVKAEKKARAEAAKEIDKAEKAASKATKDLAKERKEAWEGIAALAASAALAFGSIISAGVDATREIDRLAGSTGLATETIAGLRLAAIATGKDVEDIVPMALADRLVDLAQNTQSVVDDFDLLKLTAADFQGLNLDQSFLKLVDALANAEDQTAAAAAATRLLETDGERILATFGGGAAQLERYIEAAREIGFGSREAAVAGERWGLTLGRLSLALEEAGSEILALLSSSGLPDLIDTFSVGLVGAVNMGSQAFEEFSTWVQRLASLDFAALSPAETLARIGRIWDEGRDAAEAYAGALVETGDKTRDTTLRTEDLARSTFKLGDALKEIQAINDAANAGSLTGEQQIQRALRDRVRSIDAVIEKAKEEGASQRQLAVLRVEGAEAWAAALEEAARADAALLASRNDAINGIRDVETSARDALLEGEAAITRAHERRLEEINERVEAARQAGADETEIVRTALDAQVASVRLREQEISDLRKEQTEELRARQQQAATDITALTAQAGYSLAELLEDSGKRTRGAALAAFRVAQVAAIAQASINAALAASQGLAAAPPPFSFALAAANAAAGAVQVATIAAQQPPSFHLGTRAGDLAPDETRATLTRREVVLTPQGQQTMAADANAGVRRNTGASVVFVQIGHQVVGRAAAESVRRPTSLLSRTMKRDLPGHTRRRTS